MTSQNDNIASVNLPGILAYLPQSFTYLDAIKEPVDNSLDSNGKNIKVILLPDCLAISDDGDGMNEAVRKSKFLDFFGRTFESSKIGSKGVGAKAATAKLSNNQNMYYFTKTNKDTWPYQINVFHGDAIKNNSLSSYSQGEIHTSKNKELMTRKELVYKESESKEHAFDYLGLTKGTIFYLNNKDSCALALKSLEDEAVGQNSAVYDYVTNDLSNTYSNFLREGIKIELIFQNTNTLIKPCKMFDLSKYKEYEIRYLEEKKECYIKIDNQWNKVLYSKSTVITQFEKAKDKDVNNPKLLKFNLYHWYENDLNSYSEFTDYNKKFKSDGSNKEAEEINKMYDKVAGVYGCRNNKFTKRFLQIPSKLYTTGDNNKRPVYRGSIFVFKTDNTCDTIFETGINKSVLGTKKEGSYLTNSMNCIINNIVTLKISELKKNGIIQEYDKKKNIDESDEEYEDAKEYDIISKEPSNKVQNKEKKFELSDKDEKLIIPSVIVKKVEPLVTAKKEEKKIEPPVTAKKEDKKVEPPVTAKKEEKKVEPLVTAKKEEKKVEPLVKDKVVVPLVKENEIHKIVTEKLKAETLMCIFKKIKKPEDVDDNDWKKFEEEIQELITCKK
jgi:hypothetical protein